MNELFSPISIRKTVIKNRIVMPPMVCPGFTGEDGMVTLKNAERYRDRARGGVGLIIIEATCINKSGRLSHHQLGLWSDDQIKDFSRIADYCHEYDTKVLAQIHHAGLAVAAGVTEDPVAPSEFQGVSRSNQNIRARALTLAEITKLQDEYVTAALRAQQAGVDGILALPPYYPNADDEGLADYYAAIGAATPLGLFVYRRDWVMPSPEWVEQSAARVPTLIAWKDGQGDTVRYQQIIDRVGDRLYWIGGAGDACVPAYYRIGGTYTSSIATVAPKLSLRLHELPGIPPRLPS